MNGLARASPYKKSNHLLTTKKGLSHDDKSFFHIGPVPVQEVARAPRFVL